MNGYCRCNLAIISKDVRIFAPAIPSGLAQCACYHFKNKKMNKRFIVLAVLFCVCLIASNLFETKIFDAGVLTLTGGFVIFPISYIINDCITEVYGHRKMQFVIWMGLAMNAFLVLSAQFVRILPPADFWDGQAHFDYIFAADLRITIASMLAFLCGSSVNAIVMARMKDFQGEKGFGWRAIVSSLFGETLDSLVFFPIAFWHVGFANIVKLMLTQIVLKTMYEVLVLPVTATVVKKLKSIENE